MSWTRGNTSTLGPVSSGSLSVRDPSGARTGDLVVVRLAFRGSALFSVPAPWVILEQIGGDTSASTSNGLTGVLIAYKVNASNRRSTATFMRTGGDVAIGSIEAFTPDPGPFYVGPSEINQMAASGTTATCPAIETDREGALIVAVLGAVDRDLGDDISSFDAVDFGTAATTDSDPSTLTADQWHWTLSRGTTTGADVAQADFCVVQGVEGDTGEFSAILDTNMRPTIAVATFYDRKHVTIEGQMLTYAVEVIGGTATSLGEGGAVTLTVASSLVAGVAEGLTVAEGATLIITTPLTAGTASGMAASIGGDTLTSSVTFIPGDVSGESECTVVTSPTISGPALVGETLTAVAAEFGGVCVLDPGGAILTVSSTLIPGTAEAYQSPFDIADIVYWFDPSESATITLNGSNVATLNDKSGSGYHVTQATAASQPALSTINGVQALDFDGGDTLAVLNTTEFELEDAPYTFIFVAQFDAITGTYAPFSINSDDGLSDDAIYLGVTGGRWQMYETDNIFGGTSLTGGAADTSPHILAVISDGLTSTVRVDGVTIFSGSTNEGGVYDMDRLTLGARQQGAGTSSYFDGKLGEFVGYTRELTASEYEDLEGYLSVKWGVTLGNVSMGAETLTVSTVFVPGTVADRTVEGQTVTATTSVVAGVAYTPDATADGATVTSTTSVVAGTATGGTAATPVNALTLNGQTLQLNGQDLTLGTPVYGDFILLEDSDYMLLESGDKIKLEGSS